MAGGLFHTLNIGSEALFATRQGVDTAGHNIANAQVEGYSRQRVNIRQRDPLETHGVLIGNGVYVGSITRSHDKFIENQLNRAHQEAGRATARADAMQQLQGVFSPELNASVSDEVTKFFGSLQTLANFPADYTVRTSVVEAARDVASSFRRVDNDLKTNRAALNERIGQICEETSDDLQEIANLNVKIQVSEAGEGQQANDLRDQRDRLVRKVSQQVEIKYYDDQHGMVSIRGPNQVTLVDGGHAAKLGVSRSAENEGLYGITITDWEQHSSRDVTRKMDGGALEALIAVRDKDIPDLIAKNNEMAFTLANEVNAVHSQGFGIKEFAEQAGRNFFAKPRDLEHAASEIEVEDAIMSSNNAIAAASSPEAPGDNVNLNALIKLKDAKLFHDDKVDFNEFYANYTGALGLDTVRAGHIQEANDAIVTDLNQRRESVAGVSLDEEATNMMKWQANFTASSKVITTVDEMLNTVLELKR
jgi:flagellar hook-associated protein 1 FlgK